MSLALWGSLPENPQVGQGSDDEARRWLAAWHSTVVSARGHVDADGLIGSMRQADGSPDTRRPRSDGKWHGLPKCGRFARSTYGTQRPGVLLCFSRRFKRDSSFVSLRCPLTSVNPSKAVPHLPTGIRSPGVRWVSIGVR